MGEIEAAEQGTLRARLVEPSDLRGAFHVHRTFSDGSDSIADMVRPARERGWEYIGISDHSQSASAYGMSTAKALEQFEALGSLAAVEPGIRILHGIEADLLPDGSLD